MTMPDTNTRMQKPHDREAGKPQREIVSTFNIKRITQELQHQAPWHPFASYEEFKLTCWLLKSGLPHRKVDEFLKGDVVSCKPLNASFILTAST